MGIVTEYFAGKRTNVNLFGLIIDASVAKTDLNFCFVPEFPLLFYIADGIFCALIDDFFLRKKNGAQVMLDFDKIQISIDKLCRAIFIKKML